MASLRKQIDLPLDADAVWDAVRDVGALHTRLVAGFVTATRLEEGARIVTFANGMQVRELIVGIDDAARRLAYSAVGGRASHHNASVEVQPTGAHSCRLVWITDLLPDSVAEPVGAMMEEGVRAIRATLEAGAADACA